MTQYDRPTTGHTLTIAPELRETRDGLHWAAITYRDRAWVICTEGVGTEVTDEKPWNAGGIAYTRRQIIDLAATPGRDTVTLEAWVRMFGDRLESNFHLWDRRLMIVRDAKHEAECGELFDTADDAASHAVHCVYCHYEDDDAPLLASY